MRVLFVAGACPYPPDSGGTLRTYNLLARVCRTHDITLVAPAGDGITLDAVFGGNMRRIIPVPPASKTLGAALGAMASPLPYIVSAHEDPAMRAAVSEALHAGSYDALHCDNISVVPAIPAVARVPKVFNAHNVEAAIWERYLREERRTWMKPVIASQLRKVRAYESRLPRLFDSCVVVSEQDGERMRRYGFGTVHVVRNGVDLDYYKSLADPAEPHLLFVGSLDWRPNQDGLRWYLESIWPSIRAAAPWTKMTVVGRRPPPWVRALCAAKSVSLAADAPDVRIHLAEASVVIVPLRIGGGSRLKILEAMAAGRPVVSTKVGAEGLDARHNEHVLLADDPLDFAHVTVRLLNDPARRRALSNAGRCLVEREYGWDGIARALENAWAGARASSEPHLLRGEDTR